MENSKITPEQAQEILGIKKSQYYKRLEKLGIKPAKEHGKSYLTPEQLELLRSESSTSITTVEESSIFAEAQEPEISESEEDDLWRSAAELKAQQLSVGDLVKLHLAAGMSFEDLPEDLQEQVRTINQAANPDVKKSAASIASTILEQRRLRQK